LTTTDPPTTAEVRVGAVDAERTETGTRPWCRSEGSQHPATLWKRGAVALSVEVTRIGPDYLSGVEFGLRVNSGPIVRLSWEYPDADLLDVTTRLYRRWANGDE
jgi:hypothetical protein